MLNKKCILAIVLFVLAACRPACAADTASAPSAPAAETNATAAPAARGALYRVSRQGHVSYLFGTIHVGRPEFFPLEKRAEQAFDAAHTYALEVDMSDAAALQSAVRKYGAYAGNDTLDKHLPPDLLERVRQALTQVGIPFEGIVHFKPWMVANFFELALLERQGYHASEGVDVTLLQAAQKQGKSIVALESAEYQLSLFDKLSESEQEQYLADSLDDMQSGETVRKLRELVDAWQQADQKALEAALREMQADDSTSGKFFRTELIDKRNPAMADRVEALLKQEKASFVGVGVLHLLGEGGVPQLLARRGYAVTRLY